MDKRARLAVRLDRALAALETTDPTASFSEQFERLDAVLEVVSEICRQILSAPSLLDSMPARSRRAVGASVGQAPDRRH